MKFEIVTSVKDPSVLIGIGGIIRNVGFVAGLGHDAAQPLSLRPSFVRHKHRRGGCLAWCGCFFNVMIRGAQ